MITIVFFSANVNKLERAREWLLFIQAFSKLINSKIHLLVENDRQLQLFKKAGIRNVALHSLSSNVNTKKTYSKSQLEQFFERYTRYNLGRLRLHAQYSHGSLFTNRKLNFNHLLYSHIEFLEEFVSSVRADFVCFEKFEAYTSINVQILESVCNRHNIKTLFPHHSLKGRIAIYDNSRRVSSEIEQCFEKTECIGLTAKEEDKVLNFIETYKHFKQTEHNKHIFKKISQKKRPYVLKDVKHFSTLQMKKGFFLKNKKRYRLFSRAIRYDQFDFKNKKFVLFLPNKINNYRTNLLSPYYSNASFLIKAISISLPPTHTLIVKDHPHSYKGNMDYSIINTVDELDNCQYLDPRQDTFEIAEYANMVFCVATTTGLELLTLFKHIIYFGSEPMFFGSQRAPIKRVTNLEELPELILHCTQVPVSRKKIIHYLHSVLSNSFSRAGIEHTSWDEIAFHWNDSMDKISAEIIAEYINKTKTKKLGDL